ncbi:sulfate transporter family protein [Methylobacterium sp. BTF04]|uniref:sulfate transporter family protein n=1 Tax=Methylobacterium sp. BTF04 TaxID=2708300 RepID=UPI0013D34135|nr:sulfate transporter family protein [Methylobacterium sp. BTF04]NEU10793.1 sulfate transporter family protein [Methylobacterium sp. BTF04]
MLIQAAFAALRQVFSPPLRAILWKSLALTLGLLVVIWFALTKAIGWFLSNHHLSVDYPFLDTLAVFFAGAGLFVGLAYVMPAVSILVAGYFLDDAAEIVERTDFPNDAPGIALPLGKAMLYALRFAGLALLVNLVALILFFVPGVNLIAFFGANAYLLSREYFELAAGRFRPMPEAGAMRRHYGFTTMAAGALLAGLMVVPVLNLLTPLFGIALMVHVHKGLSRRHPAIGQETPSRLS